jgi:hypothetical protein
VETSPTRNEIRVHALRFAGNTWRRYKSYVRRYMLKYGSVSSKPTPHAYFDNRILEDSFARQDDPNSLPNGKSIERRQRLANPIMDFRQKLTDPSEFDLIYAESLGRRMPGFTVEVSNAMSASKVVHEKSSIRTFVTKAL